LQDKILKISGLGTFKLIPVESRKSINVNTGEEIEIASHYKLTFTPDVSLKEKVNEPLSHLETIEIDEDVIIENQLIKQYSILSEDTGEESFETTNQQDDPLQKLAEQALELKDILADIQELGELKQDIVEEKNVEQQIKVTVAENQENIIKQNVVVGEIHFDQQGESNKEESQNIIIDTIIVEKSLEHQILPSVPIQQDIINEINNEDGKSDKKHTKAWALAAIALLLGLIGLVVYQNIDFFAPTEDIEKDIPILANLSEESIEVKNTKTEDSLVDSNLEIKNKEVIESQNTIDSIALDKASFIYSNQFPDLFNYTREYTEFIDTVTLNEGSRLTWIAFKQYGHKDFWVYIYEANRDVITNPNTIKIGTNLRIPKLNPALIDANNQQCIDYARYLHDVYVKK
jgi:hypothetical protein